MAYLVYVYKFNRVIDSIVVYIHSKKRYNSLAIKRVKRDYEDYRFYDMKVVDTY